MNRTLACLVFLAACGGGSSSTTKKSTPEPTKPVVWKDMDLKQREQYMKDVVLPKTKELFVAFDAAKYEKMDCATCHGDGATDGTFEMPNPKIKPLPNSEELFGAWVQKEPQVGKMAEFMATKLEPLMGELLHESLFDPKTMTGEFGCTNCHELVDANGQKVTPPHGGHKDHDHGAHDHGEHQH